MRRESPLGGGAMGDAAPHRSVEWLGKVFLLGVGMFALLFVGTRAVDLHQLRGTEIQRAEREGVSFVEVFRDYVRKGTDGLDFALANIDEETRADGGLAAPEARWAELFGATVAANEEILDLYAVDGDNVVRRSTDRAAVGLPFPDSSLVEHSRTGRGVAFGPPIRCDDCPSPYALTVARRLTDADGRFAGAVVGKVDTRSLRSFARTLGERFFGAARVVMDDGTVMVVQPPVPSAIGTAVPAGDLEAWRADADGVGVVQLPSTDGRNLLVSYGRLDQYGLWVAFYRDMEDVLADWRESVRNSLIGSVLVLLAFAGGATIYFFLLAGNARVQRAARLRASELASIQRAARVTGLRWYPAGNRLAAAPGAREVIGLGGGDEPFGLGEFLSLFDQGEAAKLRESIDDCFATGAEHRMEAQVVGGTEQGCKPYLAMTVYRKEDVGDPHVFVACADHVEWQEMRAQHAHLLRMEAVGQITGGVAHDFNNLLVVILGALEDIGDEFNVSDPRHSVVDVALEAALQARELTKRLLAFARRQPLEPTTVDVRSLVEGMGPLLERAVGESVRLGFMAEPGVELWKAHIDRSQLETAMMNLVVNARDALVGGGAVTIKVRNKVVDADNSHGIEPGQYLHVTVEDTGVGMDEEIRKRSVEPYFTTKPPGKGSGLGLSQVYGFTRQSGGHFRIYSEVGGGTIVHMYLPRATGGAVAATAEEDGLEAPLEDRSILVVEDDEKVRAHMDRVLTGMGYKVVSRLDARSALRLVDEGVEFDLLLTDVMLPHGMNGQQLAREVLRRRPGVPVLFVSGYAKDVIGPGLSPTPDLLFLQKPFLRGELARKVRAALDRDDY